MEVKENDKLRVIDTDISHGYFKPGQVVMVERVLTTFHPPHEPVVELFAHAGGWTMDQFEKIEEPTIITNTPRPGETLQQIAARTAPRGLPSPLDLGPTAYAELEQRACAAQADKIAPKHVTTDPSVRAFSSGATRDLDVNKLDYEGFLSPLVLKRYAEHMHKARKMPNGDVRASDNWQLGIPLDVYMKSLFRHFFDVWSTHRGYSQGDIEAELCALLFNANGYLHEHLKAKSALQNQ